MEEAETMITMEFMNFLFYLGRGVTAFFLFKETKQIRNFIEDTERICV